MKNGPKHIVEKENNSLKDYNIAITKFNELLLKVNSSYTKWIINGRIMNAMSKTVSLYMSIGDHSKSDEVVEDILEMKIRYRIIYLSCKLLCYLMFSYRYHDPPQKLRQRNILEC